MTSVRFDLTAFILFLLTIALPAEGQFHFEKSFRSRNSAIAAAYERFAKLPQLRGASFGIIVKSASNGQTLLSYCPELNLIPASNMKLVTSLNGLKNLGPDFRFQTRILSSGPVENGVLKGDIIVEGAGDPTIYSPDREKFGAGFFSAFLAVLQKKGIKQIEGQILARKVVHPYAGIRRDWSWSDIGNYYGAGIYPLNINENQYVLHLSAPSVGKPAKVKKKDSLMDVELTDEDVETDIPSAPDLAYIYWTPGDNKARITGSIPQDSNLQKVKGAFQNPEAVFLKVLKSELDKAGIPVQAQKQNPADLNELGIVSSPPLRDIIKEVNLFSNNIMTESIAYALARKSDKLDENGWTQLERFGQQVGFPPGYYLADGSGLSLSNRISPEALSKALFWAKNQSFYPSFLASLPVSGESGTMKKFCNSERAKGKIQAKSGTLTRSLCYSGYAKAKRGELVFSIMLNSYSGDYKTMKSELEKIMEALVEIE